MIVFTLITSLRRAKWRGTAYSERAMISTRDKTAAAATNNATPGDVWARNRFNGSGNESSEQKYGHWVTVINH